MRLRCLLLVVLLAAVAAPAQTLARPSSQTDTLTPAQRTDRDGLLEPGIAKLKANQPAEAFAAFGPALAQYPADVRVLSLAGQAALLSQQWAVAQDLFTRALAAHPAEPWPTRLGRMDAEAQLGHWQDFNQDLDALRTAKKSGADPQLANSKGFLIDHFTANGQPVEVAFFPLMDSRYHTLYRFLLPKGAAGAPGSKAAVNTENTPGACQQPNFRPYVDLESDDVDQAIFEKAHPDLAARGGREYSLDTYPRPCSQGLIRFYDGEPKYETLRADLIQALTKTAPAK